MCGMKLDPSKAQPLREGSSWQMLSLDQALGVLDQMEELPSVENFICVLQKCRKTKDLAHAKRVHAHICNSGLEAHRLVGNYIVPMFVECRSLSDAQQVFSRLIYRNEHSWTSLIFGYIQCGQLQHALKLYQKMQEDRVHPSSFTFVPLLKACALLKEVERGQEIHVGILQKGFETDLVVGTALVDMYAKCGSISEAEEVLDKLPATDIVPWNALITGYAEYGLFQEALECFDRMKMEGLFPNAVTFVCILKACCSLGVIDKGREIHRESKQKGFERDLFVGSALVDMYAKCGFVSEACEVFHKLSGREVVLWTSMIAGYAEHGPCQEALKCFKQMQMEGVSPDSVTFICVLKACGVIEAIDNGREIHTEITQNGFEKDLSVASTLVDMYAKCGSLSEARKIFDKLRARDVVSWNSIIAGYAEHGLGQEALRCFEQMQLEGVFPNSVTFVYTLKACFSIGAVDKGREIHIDILQQGFERDFFVSSTLIDMYMKCGLLSEAYSVFAWLLIQDVVSWNALIAGYLENGRCREVLNCFEQMQLECVSPSVATFIYLLKVCCCMVSLNKGREIHIQIIQNGFEKDSFVASSLIDMYAKCGSLSEAQEVFHKLPVGSVVPWNALIAGYALNHEDGMALQSFEDMKEQNVKPNSATFTCLLTACSHTNLVFKGWEYFKMMRKEYAITPTVDHYTCMVYLLARSGQLNEAEKFLASVPCPLSEETWRALLSACKTYGEAELGLRCFQQLVQMNSQDSASYVLMADIYASAGLWDNVHTIEELRRSAGAKKKPATALTEVNEEVHEFVVGDNPSKEISAMMEVLSSHMRQEGHVPNIDLITRHIYDDKEVTLNEQAQIWHTFVASQHSTEWKVVRR